MGLLKHFHKMNGVHLTEASNLLLCVCGTLYMVYGVAQVNPSADETQYAPLPTEPSLSFPPEQ